MCIARSRGYDNPEGLQPGGVSQNLWPQNQSVKLLKDENQDNKDDSFYRRNQEQDQRAGNRSDERSEIRNHVRDAYDNADQYGIRQLQNGHKQEAETADNCRIQRFSYNETAEQFISFL